MARALPPHGKLFCCDVSDEWTQIARRYFAQAKVEDKIDLQIGPALETLRRLPQEPLFDIGFIDADKVNQQNYTKRFSRGFAAADSCSSTMCFVTAG